MSKIGTFFALVLSQVEADSVKTLLPIIDSVATNILANPSPSNVFAQKAVFLAQLAAALPNLYAAVIPDLVADIKSSVDAFAASLAAPKPAA